jgi:glycosyltransferase involved in cell wall biosynthesis
MITKDKQPKVSVIITTRNEERNIEVCLVSVKDQTYSNIEIIVVDNNSTDNTKSIASIYTKYIFNKGPERSSQRNFGAEKSKGVFVLFLDADMKLSKNVIKDCVISINKNKVGGIIIPEESYGIGFWAQCKKLERSFYIGNDYIEAARFFKKDVFENSGGYDVALTGPEDWDFSQLVKDSYGLARIKSYIYHNEGHLSLISTVSKKYYYSKKFFKYLKKRKNNDYSSKQFSIINRYMLFFSNPVKLFKNPLIGIGMLFMKFIEFVAGAFGYILSLK